MGTRPSLFWSRRARRVALAWASSARLSPLLVYSVKGFGATRGANAFLVEFGVEGFAEVRVGGREADSGEAGDGTDLFAGCLLEYGQWVGGWGADECGDHVEFGGVVGDEFGCCGGGAAALGVAPERDLFVVVGGVAGGVDDRVSLVDAVEIRVRTWGAETDVVGDDDAVAGVDKLAHDAALVVDAD